jgi:hypothetical protein
MALSSSSVVLACADYNPPPQPVQQYVPQSPPAPAQLASAFEGLQLAGAGVGGAIVAGSIAWALARRKA